MVVFIRDLDITNDDDLGDFGTIASVSADAYTVNPSISLSLASALSSYMPMLMRDVYESDD